jgi:hypothetical protein
MHRQLGSDGQPVREAEGVSGGVGRPIKSTLMADGRLPPLAAGKQGRNHNGAGKDGGSPRAPLGGWEGDKEARRGRASSTVGGTTRFASRKTTS